MSIVRRLKYFVEDNPFIVTGGVLLVVYAAVAGRAGYIDGTKMLNDTYARIIYDPNGGSTFTLEAIEKFINSNNYNLTQFAIRKLEGVDTYHIINLNGGK